MVDSPCLLDLDSGFTLPGLRVDVFVLPKTQLHQLVWAQRDFRTGTWQPSYKAFNVQVKGVGELTEPVIVDLIDPVAEILKTHFIVEPEQSKWVNCRTRPFHDGLLLYTLNSRFWLN